MKNISYWAHGHKRATRILLVLIYMLLNVLGIGIGILLKESAVVLPTGWLIFFLILLVLGFLFYSPKEDKYTRYTAQQFYRRQKSCDLLLITATFCTIVSIANHSNKLF